MAACVLSCLALYSTATAAMPAASAAAVKAAFVYNFIKFTEWPAGALGEADTPISICTNADDELRAALDSLNGKQAKGRSIVVRDLPHVTWQECHVAMLQEPPALTPGKTEPVLTVSTYVDDNAMLRLFLAGNRLRFAVNLRAARMADISLSAKLLSVAAEVDQGS